MRLAALTLLAAVTAVASLAPPARPAVQHQNALRANVVFILTDDLSWNLVRFMPHVRQLQRRGVTLDHYIVSDSLCCPSRSSIFTGLYPHDSGVFQNQGPQGGYHVFAARGLEYRTYATALQPRGYATSMMGKYLNGYLPIGHHVPPASGTTGTSPATPTRS